MLLHCCAHVTGASVCSSEFVFFPEQEAKTNAPVKMTIVTNECFFIMNRFLRFVLGLITYYVPKVQNDILSYLDVGKCQSWPGHLEKTTYFMPK